MKDIKKIKRHMIRWSRTHKDPEIRNMSSDIKDLKHKDWRLLIKFVETWPC